jgi:hypothetical protein
VVVCEFLLYGLMGLGRWGEVWCAQHIGSTSIVPLIARASYPLPMVSFALPFLHNLFCPQLLVRVVICTFHSPACGPSKQKEARERASDSEHPACWSTPVTQTSFFMASHRHSIAHLFTTSGYVGMHALGEKG